MKHAWISFSTWTLRPIAAKRRATAVSICGIQGIDDLTFQFFSACSVCFSGEASWPMRSKRRGYDCIKCRRTGRLKLNNIFGSLQKSHRLRSFGSDNEAKEIVPQILRAVSLARLLFAIALIQPASFVSDLRDRSVFSAFPFRWDDFPQTISTHADTAATRAAAPYCRPHMLAKPWSFVSFANICL